MRFIHRLLSGLVLCVALWISGTGCAGRPKPAALPEDLPASWSEKAGTGQTASELPQAVRIGSEDLTVTSSLLDLINDPQVTALVEEALVNNPDLKATAARLKASGFLLSQTGSRRLPEISAGATRGRNNHTPDDLGNPDAKNRYQVSASLSWELDIWGRLNDLHQSQVLSHEALTKEYTRAYDALAARVIQAWINCVATWQTLKIEQERYTALEKIETALVRRYREGLGSLEDYSAARTRTQVAKANVSSRTEAHNRALRSLEILAGRYPRAEKIPAETLPVIGRAPVLPPKATLRSRPDIQAALARIDADLLTALAAKKNRLPALRLVSEISKTSFSSSNLDTASSLWSLAAGLTQPVFQGGRLKDEALAREAEADSAVYNLARTVLRAMKEVEDTLDKETSLAFQETALATATREAAKTTDYFLTRYRSGLDNIQTLLIAQEQEMNIKTSLTDIKAARMTNRIEMALALGMGV
ncbi:MAG: TolC family protein [Desulfobacterales bacterium]|nr:TolC family protein [Desulfobacterales bacterium]